jgi:hypothetical protein
MGGASSGQVRIVPLTVMGDGDWKVANVSGVGSTKAEILINPNQ